MSTCTDLISAINAVVADPSLVVSLDPSTIATLSTGNTTETAFSLGVGGPAVLSVPSSPSVNGSLIQVTVAGKAHSASGSFGFGLYVGNSATLGSNQQMFSPSAGAGATDGNFYGSWYFLWDSVSQTITIPTGGGIAYGGVNGATPGGGPFTASTQTNIQFVVSGKFTAANGSNSATITQLKVSLV